MRKRRTAAQPTGNEADKTLRAAATLRSALRIDPDLPEAYVNLGNALSRMGDQAGATHAGTLV